MKHRFNPKQYAGKNRLFRTIPGATLVARVMAWDQEKKEYRDPPTGVTYLARRYEDGEGKRVLKGKCFSSLEEAKRWQSSDVGRCDKGNWETATENSAMTATKELKYVNDKPAPTFRYVYEEWKRRNFDRMARGTQINYEKYLRLHFQSILDVPIRAITPKLIDGWIDERKGNLQKSRKRSRRHSFLHELSVFSVVLKYYHEYFDDPTFVNPLRRRHREAAVVGRRRQENAQKDLTVEEFYRFREAILKQKSPDASALAALATVQYFQALRISEVAALHWEDVLLDWRQPKNSRLRVHRHVIYLRRKGDLSFIEEGFKNSTREDSIKEQPLFPESFAALKTLYRLHAKGLVFTNRANTFFDYRKIQSQYDRAFAKSQLPYRGTHVLRHGGTRNLYNETGDLAVAQQLLGNADLESTLVYAKRHKSALTKVADAHWESYSARVGI